MKALILLKNMKEYFRSSQVLIQTQIDESKKELEDLQNENKSLVKTLEKMNEEEYNNLFKLDARFFNTYIEITK